MSVHERAEAELITSLAGHRPARGRGRAPATLATAVLASALLAALAPAANATTSVSYAPGGANAGLTITGGGPSGQNVDKLQVFTPTNTDLRVQAVAGSSSVTAGSGCSQADTTVVLCAATGVRIVTASLGAGNDSLRFSPNDRCFVSCPHPAPVPCVCRGGPGNDFIGGSTVTDVIDGDDGDDILRGNEGNDSLNGGPGNDILEDGFSGGGSDSDVLSGGDGSDSFPNAGGSGDDVFNGGAGIDTANFIATSTVGVSVTLDNVANDGRPGQSQNVGSDVEHVVGTAGNDVLVGGAQGSFLAGLAGNDTLRGGEGNDTLDGGLGRDVLTGLGGNDLLQARDGEDDQFATAMSCGGGRADGILADRIVADLKDDDTRPIPADCESVDQSDRREGPNVVVRSGPVSVGGDGVLSVRLSCPRQLRKRCSGTLAARVDKRGSSFGPPTRYSIRPGRSASVKTRLRASQRAAARRRGARVALRSLERGLHGTKTTLRSLPARRA